MAFQDFDLISQRRQEEKKKKFKQRLILAFIVSVIVILLAAAAVCFAIYKSNDRNHHDKSNTNHSSPPPPPPKPKTTQNVVKTVCATTDYKKTCESSIMKEVKNNASATPMEILRASLAAAEHEIDAVIKQAKDIKFDTPMKKAAFNDCLTLFKDAKEEINTSILSIKGKDLSKLSSIKPELNNWLSAVVSYQQTCIDGFPDGAEKDGMKTLLSSVRMLGSNALAVVAKVTSVLSRVESPKDSQRRLLSFDKVGFPTWLNHEHRRMLKTDAAAKFTPNVTVAKDNTGNFTTINEALKAMPKTYKGRYLIYIKEGVYNETVVVTKEMANVTMYGDGSQKSIITGSKSFDEGVPTYGTATFAALGAGFMAQSLGFKNTAGPEKHQAVALRVQSDRSIFLNCRMEGYQVTLYTQTHRQFYRSCYITGTVDFIFGDAAAVFQNCMIYLRKPMENQDNTVTAQGRVEKRETTGIVLQNCRILADEKLEPEKAKFKSYLGRPSKEYSRTIVMESDISDVIQPEGWKEKSGEFALKTLFYAEFGNKGAGSNTKDRVKWAGFKNMKRDEAETFTVGPFLQGEEWLKVGDVPVRFGMFT